MESFWSGCVWAPQSAARVQGSVDGGSRRETLLHSRSVFGHQDLSSRATVHTDASPCRSNKGVSCAPSVGFCKEQSSPAHMVMVGVAHMPSMGSAALTLGPLPVCQAGLSLPRLPGHAAYHTAMLILSHVRDGESAQSKDTPGDFKSTSPGSQTRQGFSPSWGSVPHSLTLRWFLL